MTKIRMATLSDAKKLAKLAERTFRDTSAEHTPPEDMASYCRRTFGEKMQARELADPECSVLVVQWNDQLIAYAQLRWRQSPECVSGTRPGEIQRLYVDKTWHGKGLAQELMEACLTVLDSRNSDSVWLAVWENNPRAISFYKKFAFREIGNQVFPIGTDLQTDIIMERACKNHDKSTQQNSYQLISK